jgi:hypothetical protein
MHFRATRPDIVRSVSQRWLLKNWMERRGGRPLPTWQEPQGREYAGMSRHLCFFDVVREAGKVRFLMRSHSAWLGEVYGFDCHNQYLDEMQSGRFQGALIETYRHVVASRGPVYASVDIADRDGRLVHYERLLLPFGQDRETVDRVLASLEMVSPEGAFEHRHLVTASAPSSSFAICATIQSTAPRAV